MNQLKFFLIAIAVTLVNVCPAQMMPRHTISAGGGNYESAVAHVSWTIGQSEPVATIYQPTVILHGGFQQNDAIPVSIQEVEREDEILLYPNPCEDQVTLDIKLQHPAELSIQLYDVRARLQFYKTISESSDHFKENIELGFLPPGIYNIKLMIRDEKSWSIQSIKVVKH